jgi:CheY-like chemotaxis protein
MGGVLSLESTPGEGSSFSFTLEFARAPKVDVEDFTQSPPEPLTGASTPKASMSNGDGVGRKSAADLAVDLKLTRRMSLQVVALSAAAPRILIVDDAPVNCKLLKRTIQQSSKRLAITTPIIDIAVNGQEAVDIVAARLAVLDTIDAERGECPHSAPFNLICLVHISLFSLLSYCQFSYSSCKIFDLSNTSHTCILLHSRDLTALLSPL